MFSGVGQVKAFLTVVKGNSTTGALRKGEGCTKWPCLDLFQVFPVVLVISGYNCSLMGEVISQSSVIAGIGVDLLWENRPTVSQLLAGSKARNCNGNSPESGVSLSRQSFTAE